MRIVFLASAERDLRWFRRYYEDVFPEGRKRALARYVAATRALQDNPHIGHPVEDLDVRKFSIPGTPFHFVYRVRGEQIQILQVGDGRSDAAALSRPQPGIES